MELLIVIGIVSILCIFLIYPMHVRYHNLLGMDVKEALRISAINSFVGVLICSFLIREKLTPENIVFLIFIGIIFLFINRYLLIKGRPKKMLKKIRKEENKKEKKMLRKLIKEENKKRKLRFCKFCGEKLVDKTKCSKCGRRYFNIEEAIILTAKIFFIIMFLGLSTYTVYLHFYKIKDLNNEIEQLEIENSDLEWSKLKYQIKADFLDENIVFVIKGKGKKYYTYDCMQKITAGESYTYWAYNISAAKGLGYKYGSCGLFPWND